MITCPVCNGRRTITAFVDGTNDECGSNGSAKRDADNIAKGLNLLVQYGREDKP